MNYSQVPALRPLPSHPNPSAALQGATTAFLPKHTVAVPNEPSASAGAKLAAVTAGSNAREKATSTSIEARNGQNRTSPPRGRQLHPPPNVAQGAKEPAASPQPPNQLHIPGLSLHPSSMLAARHASTHSRSPRRSPSRSPYASTASIILTEEDGLNITKSNALSGAIASMAANTARESVITEDVQPVKSRIMAFERSPVSLQAETARRSSRSVTSHDNRVRPIAITPPSEHDVPKSSGTLIGRLPRAYSVTDARSIRRRISHHSSDERTATLGNISGPSQDQSSEPKGRNHVSHSTARPRPAMTQTKSHSQNRLTVHDDYRSAMSVNALADAMVASSLASSRAASPSKAPAPSVPRRRSRSFTTLYDMNAETSKTTLPTVKTPARTMKQTLRNNQSSDDEEVGLIKRGRRHWMRKHPNKHSEGDRKRWRDKVTERERKRYEGVFAANRGLLLGSRPMEYSPDAFFDSTAIGNQVVNIVVRDVWDRSRLPREVLREIYDLVCPEETLSLNREQFVVGLWLVDQRLKGRKLPAKVSTSVWASVRHSQGIKIRNQIR